ncbi:MTAP family purine nucleoside phosphorylase [Luteimicrobium subarcticum]|uniref:S-methyl-5'-thioadenosine phosphorylase n=1 Tax=Luteimicrobium subarcticum TaxID=620910 RepID=A0A2M8W1V5_9MICO|nr:MTAP family purine nucleoside phosphorylase [Luteimicrobium subarcticum]PJI84888.1 5'-methylthioadenosine phosphorylase [Luteimicrobium subarcticum]
MTETSADPTPRVAVVGGSGLYRLFDAGTARELDVATPFGSPSAPLTVGEFGGRTVAFLPRHGTAHTLPPHAIEARANLWALASLGVRAVVSSTAVGGLAPDLPPGRFVLPDQLIDRTTGRADTYFTGGAAGVEHLAAADPFCPALRHVALDAARRLGEDVAGTATTVVVQGPRFSTRAESQWFRAAGADIVNMTQYPETVLAAELGMGLVNLSFVTDTDAGVVAGDADAADASLVLARMAAAQPRLLALLAAIVAAVPEDYEPRELVPREASVRVLALPVAGAGA